MAATIDSNKRHKVFMKTFYHCGYCGKILQDPDDLTIDHIVPQSADGSNEFANLIGCCHSCNQLKADLSLSQFRNKLIDAIKISNVFTDDSNNENVIFFFERYSENYLRKINNL